MDLWTAIIAAGAAILASTLTSYLTHRFQQQQSKREHELKWLEERFGPALDFLGRVSALVGNAPNTQEGRRQMADEIRNIVMGSSAESNAWCIAALLDPEDTGLRDQVLSALTYARITGGDQEFINYQAKLHWSLQALAEEFRRERQAVISGKSLEILIRGRKAELAKHTQELEKALNALRTFVDGKAELDSTLRQIERSRVRGANLDWTLKIVTNVSDQEKQGRVETVHRECKNRGWIRENQK